MRKLFRNSMASLHEILDGRNCLSWSGHRQCNTKIVNTTPHTSHFLVQVHAHAWLKSCVCRALITCHDSSSCAHVFVLTLFDYSTFFSLLTVFSLIILSFFLPTNFIFQEVVDKSSLCTLATDDFGTFAKQDPLTKMEQREIRCLGNRQLQDQERCESGCSSWSI